MRTKTKPATKSKLSGPREIEYQVARRMMDTGAVKITERGNENLYLTTIDGEQVFCKIG